MPIMNFLVYCAVLLGLLSSAVRAEGWWESFKNTVNESSEAVRSHTSLDSWSGYLGSHFYTFVPKHAVRNEVVPRRTNPQALFKEASRNLLLVFEGLETQGDWDFHVDAFDFIFSSSGSLLCEGRSSAWMSHLVKAAYKCGKIGFCKEFIQRWTKALWWRTNIGFKDDSVRSAHWTLRLAWILEEFQVHFRGQPVLKALTALVLNIWEDFVRRKLVRIFDGIRMQSIFTQLEVLAFKLPDVFGHFFKHAWVKLKFRLTAEERCAFINALLQHKVLNMSDEAADILLGSNDDNWQKVADFIRSHASNSASGSSNALLKRYLEHEPKPNYNEWLTIPRSIYRYLFPSTQSVALSSAYESCTDIVSDDDSEDEPYLAHASAGFADPNFAEEVFVTGQVSLADEPRPVAAGVPVVASPASSAKKVGTESQLAIVSPEKATTESQLSPVINSDFVSESVIENSIPLVNEASAEAQLPPAIDSFFANELPVVSSSPLTEKDVIEYWPSSATASDLVILPEIEYVPLPEADMEARDTASAMDALPLEMPSTVGSGFWNARTVIISGLAVFLFAYLAVLVYLLLKKPGNAHF